MAGGQRPRKTREQKQESRKEAADTLAELEKNVRDFDLESGVASFAELPMSQNTLRGLKASHFTTLTDIQKRAIPLILKGRDVLGAARTGSGKTLAFLVPVLELLYRNNWTQFDGLGALIISPTRELALQIFEVLRKIGRSHGFSAGLVIGGKDLKEEADRMLKMNILVCTPGRLLQHMDQTAGFQADNLQVLVLDEADRILDMGFRKTLDAIVDNLPPSRQTLLFSATQTKSVKDLARLSLKEPEYVAVHESSASATPAALQQNYVLTTLPEKLDTLFGFMKTHLKNKVIVFMSTGKQVRFAYETFRHLHPGVSLIHLHGKQKQTARAEISARFASSQHCYLFCTDIVARGLDFPAVDWVVQLDAPEDADTYIHRVGRTARYEKGGKALLMLLPSEEGAFLARLHSKKVNVEKLNIKANKKQSIVPQLQHMCFKDPEIKYLGQKAFVSYVRSVNLQKDKDVFKAESLPVEEFAASLGLPGAPKIKFVSAKEVKAKKNAVLEPDSGDDDDSAHDSHASDNSDRNETERVAVPEKKAVRTKYDRMFERRNQDILTDHYTKLIDQPQPDPSTNDTADADEDDDFMKLKRKDHTLTSAETAESFKPDSKRKQKEALSKKAMLKYKSKGQKLVFDEDGSAHPLYEMESEEAYRAAGAPEHQIQAFLSTQRAQMGQVDEEDKTEARDKKREKRRERLERQKALEQEEADDGDHDDGNDDDNDYADEDDGDEDQTDGEEDEDERDMERDSASPGTDTDRLSMPTSTTTTTTATTATTPAKRKKWFEENAERIEEEDRRKRAKSGDRFVVPVDAEPLTLDDQEALALKLLGRHG